MSAKNILMPGEKYGRLTLIEKAKPVNGRAFWKCRCECGRECIVQENHIKSGHTKSCGCRNGKPVCMKAGAKFGNLTLTGEALRRNGRRYWNCICDCGNRCVVEENHLKSGHTKSCGCLVKKRLENSASDLQGKRFGRLTAIEATSFRNRDSVVWKCMCDCGNETFCSSEELAAGNVRSCGCLQREQRKINMKTAIHFVDGTCVEKIACQKETTANTSGHRGVYRRENGKWRASMDFKKKRWNLGTYETFEEAVAARLEGEKMYTTFLEEYHDMELAGK